MVKKANFTRDVRPSSCTQCKKYRTIPIEKFFISSRTKPSTLAAKVKPENEMDNSETDSSSKAESGPGSNSGTESALLINEPSADFTATPTSKEIMKKRERTESVSADESFAPAKKARIANNEDDDLKLENSASQDSSEALTADEIERIFLMEINSFLVEVGLNLVAVTPTRGDGNCWFRAVADQIALLDIKNKPKDHVSLRINVANTLKMLPEKIKSDIISVIFMGKPRGLSDLAYRQKKPGQWVDDNGVMVLATAHYLARNINIYSYPTEQDTRKYNVTQVEGGLAANNRTPLSVFLFNKHYQSLKIQDLNEPTINSVHSEQDDEERTGSQTESTGETRESTDGDPDLAARVNEERL